MHRHEIGSELSIEPARNETKQENGSESPAIALSSSESVK
jgi:hypothetical protein